MLKLKRIDLLIKNDKIHKNEYCDHVQKYKKLECLCWEEWRVGMGGWLQFGRGEVRWERRRGRRKRNREREYCRQSGYIMAYRRNVPVDDSDGENVMSLYDYLSFNPSVKSSEKNPWKYHVTVRLSRFKSVGKIILQKSMSPHHCNFPNKLYRPSAIRSVYTNGSIFQPYRWRNNTVIIYRHSWKQNYSIGKNYRRKNSVYRFLLVFW
jgi:hypothetical protein